MYVCMYVFIYLFLSLCCELRPREVSESDELSYWNRQSTMSYTKHKGTKLEKPEENIVFFLIPLSYNNFTYILIRFI